MPLKKCVLFTCKRQGMLDDYVPGKVENSNKLEVSDVGQFKAFKYLKYKYQSIKYQKKKATEVRDIQEDKNPNIIVWVSFHNTLHLHLNILSLTGLPWYLRRKFGSWRSNPPFLTGLNSNF